MSAAPDKSAANAEKDGALARLREFAHAFKRGETTAALEAASAACFAAPNLAEAHYAYGQAWMACGKPARAQQAFAAAARLRPGWADAWVNFGLARYAQGAIGDAKTAMSRALQASSDHAAATTNLAALMRLTGEYDAAERLLGEALARNPRDAAARLNLVADRLLEERPADALALLDAVDPPSDDLSAARYWHLQRALAMTTLGRIEKAKIALGEFDALGPAPRELAPLRLWRTVLIARAEGAYADARAAAAQLEVAIAGMGPHGVLEHKIMAHYNLAKFWSAEGDRAAAFVHWRAGHRLLRPVQPFSREATKAYIDAAIATFTPQRYACGPRATHADPTPVFIIGMPRSGTTLAEQILAAHSQVHGAGERAALARLAWRLGNGDGPKAIARTAALDEATLQREAGDYLSELRGLAPDKCRVIDKMPGNYLYVWLIALLFPNAKIIHCVRDPRDIGLSIFTFRFYGEHGYAHDLSDLGWMIGEQHVLMKHWKATLPVPILTVRLDDWVTNFDATLARVLAHVDLPYEAACARFHEVDGKVRTVSRSQVKQPVNARGLGRWRAYAGEIAPLVAELERAGALEEWRS